MLPFINVDNDMMQLQVEDPLVEETGFYICHYGSLDDIDWHTDKQHVDSTYVYIDG